MHPEALPGTLSFNPLSAIRTQDLVVVGDFKKCYVFRETYSYWWIAKKFYIYFIYIFVGITVPGDGLAPDGARPSSGAVMTKFGFHILTWPALAGSRDSRLDSNNCWACYYSCVYSEWVMSVQHDWVSSSSRSAHMEWTATRQWRVGMGLWTILHRDCACS